MDNVNVASGMSAVHHDEIAMDRQNLKGLATQMILYNLGLNKSYVNVEPGYPVRNLAFPM